MKTTKFVNKKDAQNRKTYIIDAKDKILGRVAVKVAVILMGKDKPIFTPNCDCGDCVIITNAKLAKVTGNKLLEKEYFSFSGYPGGQKITTLEKMLIKKPTEAMRAAVKGMLPKSPLGRKMLKKLRVYADDKHGHQAQKPIEVGIN